MVNLWLVIVALVSMVGVSEAQVNQGTVNAKALDGNGNKITSSVTGPSRGLDINCLAGCVGSGGVSSANNDGACPSGAANFTVVASNVSRTWLAMWASATNTDNVYIKLGATATSSDALLAPGQVINFTNGRIYTGQVDAIPASGTQAVCLMELN